MACICSLKGGKNLRRFNRVNGTGTVGFLLPKASFTPSEPRLSACSILKVFGGGVMMDSVSETGNPRWSRIRQSNSNSWDLRPPYYPWCFQPLRIGEFPSYFHSVWVEQSALKLSKSHRNKFLCLAIMGMFTFYQLWNSYASMYDVYRCIWSYYEFFGIYVGF